MIEQSNLAQTTINQRLKILIKSLGISVRAFSTTLEVPESSTRNYLDKGTKLNSDYIEKIVHHFRNINLNWLITGEGEPLIGEATVVNQSSSTRIKNNQGQGGQVIGTNHGTASQHNYTISDCEKERDAYKTERDQARQQVEHLQAQIATKDALIASKEETIELLKAAFNRPN